MLDVIYIHRSNVLEFKNILRICRLIKMYKLIHATYTLTYASDNYLVQCSTIIWEVTHHCMQFKSSMECNIDLNTTKSIKGDRCPTEILIAQKIILEFLPYKSIIIVYVPSLSLYQFHVRKIIMIPRWTYPFHINIIYQCFCLTISKISHNIKSAYDYPTSLIFMLRSKTRLVIFIAPREVRPNSQ